MVEPISTGRRPARRKVFWLVLIGVGVLVVAIVAFSVLDVATMKQVGVVNTGPNDVRLSSCVDDALDLSSGQSSEVEVPKSSRVGCDVFVGKKYAGCLVLQSRDPSPVDILSRLDRQMSQGSCEKIG
jgi:hypothetical protein